MKRQDFFISALLFLIGVLSRFPLIEKMQSHWDGPEYSIGILHYSFDQHTPSVPGYPLYIAMGRFFYFFTHDPHLALLLISVLFSGVGAVVFFISGKIIFNRITGIISSLIFLSGSTFYYFGITAYGYILLPTISCLIALLSYLIVFKGKKNGIVLGILFAISLGIRPQEMIFMSPLIFFSFIHMTHKERIKFILAFILIFLTWFIPYVKVAGGFKSYIATISETSALKYFASLLGINEKNIVLMVKGFFLSVGAAGFFLLYYIFSIFKKGIHVIIFKREIVVFFSAWILPTFLFNFFIISVHAGYQMDYLSALVILSSFGIYMIFKNRKNLIILSISFIISINLLLFFWDRDPMFEKPYRYASFHYTDVRKNDIKMGSKISFIKNHFISSKTIIITTSPFWRQYMYYLRSYKLYDIEALFTTDSKFRNTIRESFDWKYIEYEGDKEMFIVPSGITNLILVDDEYKTELKNLSSKEYYLSGRSKIIVISVKSGDKISFRYRFLEKFNN